MKLHAIFDQPEYRAGQEIHVLVFLKLDRITNVQRISVAFEGKESVQFPVEVVRRDTDGEGESRLTEIISEQRCIFRYRQANIVGGGEAWWMPGCYMIPLCLQTPSTAPSSMWFQEGARNGQIEYSLRVILHQRGLLTSNLKSNVKVRIKQIQSERSYSHVHNAIYRESIPLGCCCITRGQVQLTSICQTCTTNLCSEILPIDIEIDNRAGKIDIKGISLMHYLMISLRGQGCLDRFQVAIPESKVKGPPISRGEYTLRPMTLEIADTLPSVNSDLLTVEHWIRIGLSVPYAWLSWHRPEMSIPFSILN